MPATKRADFLARILDTALEGGINYWASIRVQPVTISNTRSLIATGVEVRDTHDAADAWRPVSLATIERGIIRIKNKNFQIRKNILGSVLMGDRNDDAGEIDATTADCIIQAGLFGELKYG